MRSGKLSRHGRVWWLCALAVAIGWTTCLVVTQLSSASKQSHRVQAREARIQRPTPTHTDAFTHPPAMGSPTVLDPTGRSGRRALASERRQLIDRLGEWKTRSPRESIVEGVSYVPQEFCESSAARLDDLVVVVGGFLCDFNRITDRVQALNTTTGEWRTIARLPATAAKTHHGAAMWRVSPNMTWLYLVSGQLGPGCTVGTTESWALLIRKKKVLWFQLPDLPEVRYAPSAYVDSQYLHVVGGAGPNRRDPRQEHWALPLLSSGHAAKAAGWFLVDSLPDGGTDSCGLALARDYVYRFGGQHGHPSAVNVLVDNNKQCQDSPEVARTTAWRRKLGNERKEAWEMVAPLPWPASHIGLSTASFGDNVVVVSGKLGKVATRRVALYDVVEDRWKELQETPFGQPDFLVWFDTSGKHLHALKFKWHPTNTTLNDDLKSVTDTRTGRRIKWPGAFTHYRAWIKWVDAADAVASPKPPPKPKRLTLRPLHEDFGVQVLGLDLFALFPEVPRSVAVALRSALDEHGVLLFRDHGRRLDPTQLVALHAIFDHDLDAPPNMFHRGMCRLWRLGLPQVNLLANRAVPENSTVERGALADDGRPCVAGSVYGMESYAWHSDETARPGGLSVQATVFQAAVLGDAARGETHFASGARAFERLDHFEKRKALKTSLKYIYNAKSYDAFLPPLEVSGRRDEWLLASGTAKVADDDIGRKIDDLVRRCVAMGTCRSHVSPLVAAHPRTNRPALHLDVKQQLGIPGVNFSDSQHFLRTILDKATGPGRVYKHRWQENDVLITDNFAVLHTAAPAQGFNEAPRLIERVCLPGGHVPSAPRTAAIPAQPSHLHRRHVNKTAFI